VLGNPRFRTMKLEDGEEVIMLRGSRKKPLDPNGRPTYRSNCPHAGVWGKKTCYVLVPSARGVSNRARKCLSFGPGLVDRSGDFELLILGPSNEITNLITSGPSFCRAMTRRTVSPERAESMRQFRFQPAQ